MDPTHGANGTPRGVPLTLKTVATWCARNNQAVSQPRVRNLLSLLGFGSFRNFVECDHVNLKRHLEMEKYETNLGERTLVLNAHVRLRSITPDQLAAEMDQTNRTTEIPGCTTLTLEAVAEWCAKHPVISRLRASNLLTLLGFGSVRNFVDCDREDLKEELQQLRTNLGELTVMLMAYDDFGDRFGGAAAKKRLRDDEVTELAPVPKISACVGIKSSEAGAVVRAVTSVKKPRRMRIKEMLQDHWRCNFCCQYTKRTEEYCGNCEIHRDEPGLQMGPDPMVQKWLAREAARLFDGPKHEAEVAKTHGY